MMNRIKQNNQWSTRTKARIGASLAMLAMIVAPLSLPTPAHAQNFGNVFGMSKSDEIQLGQQTAREVESKNKIVTSGPQYDRLQRVAARILPLARKDYDVPFSVKLIDSKEINAFALPGGPIYFYTGLMNLAATDDEVASVLGHEATHVVKRHTVKQISDSQTKNAIASIFLGKSSDLAKAAAGLYLQYDQLKFSRKDESQADEFGFKYLVNAGYNPEAMASFFRKMGEKTGNGGTEWLQSHPLTKNRVNDAEKRAKEYEASHGTVK